jgi:molecular chaperone GrpE
VTDEREVTQNGTGSGDMPAPTPPVAPEGPRVVDKRSAASDPPVDDVVVSAAEPADEIDEIDELGEARAEAAQYLDDLRRLKAEFENYRKRMVREQTAMAESAAAGLVEQLLPVLDDFELALIAADRTKDYESLVRGVELVFSKLAEVLHRQGLRKIEAHNALFDPELHEAVMQDDEGPEDGKPTVAEVFRTGYTLNGRVLRPTMVKVRKH